jgi:mono/diheme cytochrome c family protein
MKPTHSIGQRPGRTIKPDEIAGLGVIGLAVVLTLSTFSAIAVDAASSTPSAIERGRYLVQTAGCNDCHTAGYAESGGRVPEQDWLKGDALGWKGPWGTTYASNLRLYMQDLDGAEWVARSKALAVRPPMPWFMLRDMTDEDRLAIYQYIRSLGPAGEKAPGYLPPGVQPPVPYVEFHLPVPQAQPSQGALDGSGRSQGSSHLSIASSRSPG